MATRNTKRMSGRKKQKSKIGDIRSVPALVEDLYQRSFFASEKKFEDVRHELGRLGNHPTDNALQKALSRAKFLTKRGSKGLYSYIQKHAPEKLVLSREIFPDELVAVLKNDFSVELDDLRLNYGRSGNCTAFLLRKILEKLIFITFSKNGQHEALKDPNGDVVGLKTLLRLAVEQKVDGKPFLMSKTAKEIEGIKFLGDTSAHNPLAHVSMSTIEPVMPYIVTAYVELAKKLA